MFDEFGCQTVGIVTITQTGGPGYLGIRETERTVVLRHNVHFRPFNTSESYGQTDVSTEIWKLTDSYDVVSIAAESNGEILYDGTDNPADTESNRFLIDGAIQPKHSLDGPDHVTIMCKRQVM